MLTGRPLRYGTEWHLPYIDRKRFSRSLASVAVALTLLAGYIDAIGYLSLGHIYVANMSGNSVAVGVQASRFDGAQVWRSLWPIISFMVGVLVSRFIVGWGARAAWRSLAAPVIAFEVLALAGFMVAPPGAGGVFLAACAMGSQAATLSRFNGVTVYTSFVTGTLVKFGEHLADGNGLWAAWFGGIWTAYIIGAILGGTAVKLLSQASVAPALGVLILLGVFDLVSPAELDRSVAE